MTGLADRLHPGRDANGSSWAVVRYPQDWRAGVAARVTYSASGRALELAPAARPELAVDWLPTDPAAGPDGTLYQADPRHHRLYVKGPCDEAFKAVAGVGGKGAATGRFDTPIGVAVDAKGRVYVADAGNGRVQVILPGEGEVLAVLSDGLLRPIHVALGDDGEIHVLDAATARVVVFTDRFAFLRSFPIATLDLWTEKPWTAPPEPAPRAIAVRPDGSLVVFDPRRPAMWRMSPCGEPLLAASWPGPGEWPPGWPPVEGRFAADGEIVLGPIDGGVHNLAWHRVMIDADLPAGTALTVQSFASNKADARPLAFAPRRPVPVTGPETTGREAERLVLPDLDGWSRWQAGRLERGRPQLHRFAGAGPSGVDRLTLPWAAARTLRAGDRVVLRTEAGGETDAGIVQTPARRVSVAAAGGDPALAPTATVELLAREAGPLGLGPLDLEFLGFDPAQVGLVGLRATGHPEDIELPHALAAFLRPGDIVALRPSGLRAEVLEIDDGEVELLLDAAVAGDFSTGALLLGDTAGRLVVGGPLPDTGQPPSGATITVMDDIAADQVEITWIDAAAGVIWLAEPLAGDVTADDWVSARFASPPATDRGRYLWLRLRLQGAVIAPRDGIGAPTLATATPSIRALRIIAPRPSLLEWLPAVYSRRDPNEDAPGGNFLERFLTLFEGQFTRVEDAFESVSRLLNPDAADEGWLTFVASWLELAFDPSWPVERKRQLVREGWALQAGQGTPAALARFLEIYTGARPAIGEAYLARPPAPIQLGARGALGVAPLGGGEPDPHDAFAHRFTVSVTLPPGRDRTAARATVRKIIETMKPAHTHYFLDTGQGVSAGIGIDGIVGGIVIPGPEAADPCACDPDDPMPGAPRGHVAGGFRLGGSLGRGGQREWISEGV